MQRLTPEALDARVAACEEVAAYLERPFLGSWAKDRLHHREGVQVALRIRAMAAKYRLRAEDVSERERERDDDEGTVTALCTMCGIPGCEGGCMPSYAP